MNPEVEPEMTFMRALGEDVVNNFQAYREDAVSQTARRNFIRSECAYVEGMVWFFKKLVRSHIEDQRISIDGEIKLYLHDFDFKVTRSGKIEKKEKRLPTIDNLKALLKSCGEIYGYEVGIGNTGWGDLQDTFGVRDRIMHPSTDKAIMVSEAEMETGIRGYEWFESERSKILQALKNF